MTDNNDKDNNNINNDSSGRGKDIEYHTQDQRKHYRLNTPIWVKADGKTYKTNDWSVGGLSLDSFHKAVNAGDELELKVLIKFQGFNIGFDAKAKAIGAKNNKLRLKFVDLSDRSKNILQFFSQSIISGQMIDIEDAIKRIDIPINLQEESEDSFKNQKRPFFRYPLKTIFFTLFYLTAGLCLLLYLVLVIYSNFVHMKIESAVVTAPSEGVISPYAGIIEKIYVDRGATVKGNEPLIRIKDPSLEHLMEVERTNHETLKSDLDLKIKNLEAEKTELSIYKTIGLTKVSQARENLQALIERTENLQQQHERAKVLYAKHYIAKADLDKAESDHETSMHQVEEARNQYEVEMQAVKAIDAGHYFSKDTLQGAVPQHQALVEQAKRTLRTSQQRMASLEKQLESHTLRVPFDGNIIEISKSRGNTVSIGDPLAMVEHNATRTITAFLTQDEVVEVVLGGNVTVYIPSLKKRFAGKILSIDRTDGFVDEVNAKFKPRTVQDRSAQVNIALTDFSMEDSRKLLAPGTPTIVYFDRSLSESIWHRISLYFTPMHTPNEFTKKNKKQITNTETSRNNTQLKSLSK